MFRIDFFKNVSCIFKHRYNDSILEMATYIIVQKKYYWQNNIDENINWFQKFNRHSWYLENTILIFLKYLFIQRNVWDGNLKYQLRINKRQ